MDNHNNPIHIIRDEIYIHCEYVLDRPVLLIRAALIITIILIIAMYIDFAQQ
jgi:hypothetical protein